MDIRTARRRNASDSSKRGVIAFGNSALRGLAWILAQSAIARVCSLLSQLALAALLRPNDFGLIGLTYTITNIVSTLLNVGVDDVLLRRPRSLKLWVGPAFWMSLGLATAAGVLVIAIAPFAAVIYRAPEVVGLVAVIALSMPIGALASVPTLILRSRMQFRVIATYGAVEILAQSTLTVFLAWQGFGAYSFVLPIPIFALVRSVVLWRVLAYTARYRPKLKRWRHLLGDTAANFGCRVVMALTGQGDYVVLGLFASQAAVGVYYLGFRLAAQPLWTLAGGINSVVYPTLVQITDDPARQGKMALMASNLLSFCVMPLALLQAAVAAPVVAMFFNQKWASLVPIIQILSIGFCFDVVSWIAGALMAARGEFLAGFLILLMEMPVFFIFVVIGERLDGAVGVAWGVCAYYVVTQPVFVGYVYRKLGLTLWQIALIYLRPATYASISVAAALAISLLPMLDGRPLARAVIICTVTMIIYLALVRSLAPDVWSEVRSRISKALRPSTI